MLNPPLPDGVAQRRADTGRLDEDPGNPGPQRHRTGLSQLPIQYKPEDLMADPIYALNLFNVEDRGEYLAYSRRSAKEVQAHGGRVVALGKFREAVTGEIKPRSVMILVEWRSKEAFDEYCNDPKIADLHPHRENGACDYIWHLFDKLDDLRPVLK